MSLTLKEFREVTKNLPEETIINIPIESENEFSIRGTINMIHIVPKKYSYSKQDYVMLCRHNESDKSNLVRIKKWKGLNEPIRIK